MYIRLSRVGRRKEGKDCKGVMQLRMVLMGVCLTGECWYCSGVDVCS